MEPSELKRIFEATIPRDFLLATVQVLGEAYRRSFDLCLEFQPPETHDARPHVRRALVEGGWRTLAGRYPDLRADSVLNKKRSAYHTTVACGRIVLTESAIESRTAVVRPAEFRRDYAYRPQMAFGFMDMPAPIAEAPIYALLVHGSDALDPTHPAFVDVVFPNQDCSAYVARIDLLHMVEAESRPASAPTEKISEDRIVRMRPRPGQEREA